jgi:hypothetical protein
MRLELSVCNCAYSRQRDGLTGHKTSTSRPATVVVTTPNFEHNVKFETLPAGAFRHKDHRFEWTRDEFQAWAHRVARRFGYTARFLPIGPEDVLMGAPSQMGIFSREATV